jgi:hypothetical protein
MTYMEQDDDSGDKKSNSENESDADLLRQVLSAHDASAIALRVNSAPSGNPDSRHTQAIVRTNSATRLFTQREYNAFDGAITQAEQDYGVQINERVIGDNPRVDEHIHAEMLAVSTWFTGGSSKPVVIGVSQTVCARCASVLDLLGIDHAPTDENAGNTRNWVHPLRHAEIYAYDNLPEAVRNDVTAAHFTTLVSYPEIVRRGRERQFPNDGDQE